ncbi:MAG: amidohydrolase family protein [Verrucomicrobia bacterium]|nr:amidohydrolase family protein [Verrucomicrobiota bacterium]
MKSIDRRSFLKGSLLTAAAAAFPASLAVAAAPAAPQPAPSPSAEPEIIDTNVNLFHWPYRRLKYDDTRALVAKLRRHRIAQAWAGSFEALLHKNVSGVNARLAEECRANGGGMLLPFGTVNPAWPDWEEDLRRCQDVHRMPGIRLYPGYQHCGFENPEFARLLQMAGDRGMIVQIAGEMEEPRVHHPNLALRDMDLTALAAALKAAPHTKVHLVHFAPLIFISGGQVSQKARETIRNETGAFFDISRLEGNGILGRVLGVDEPLGPAAVGRLPLERILFASHAPYFPVEASVMRLFESPLSQPQMLAVMQGNARRLLASARRA